jgi:hypothetical protein
MGSGGTRLRLIRYFASNLKIVGALGMQPHNKRLGKLVNQWRDNGSPEQEAFPWQISKRNWTQLAYDFDIVIDNFPELIDRQFLWDLSSSSAPVRSAFLAIMVWGYGDIGYGPHRVRQMYESEGFEKSIKLTKELCQAAETVEAYIVLKNSRIRQLGPSFGSKVLTFFHKPGFAPAIFDSIVAKWLNENAPTLFGSNGANAETWSVTTYERYNKWIADAASDFQISACNLEQLIFSDGYTS